MRSTTRRRGARLMLAVLPFTVTAALTGCAAFDTEHSGIVVTTNILGDITRTIVADQAEVTVLMKADADPHSFGISAQQAAALEQAELIVHNGLGLEEGILGNVAAATAAGVTTVAVAEGVDPIEYSQGDSAGQPDPHFWTDPVRVGMAVELIAEQVVDQVSGVDAEQVHTNARKYGDLIDELHDDTTALFDEIAADQRKLVTNHHVFGYLAQRYDFEVLGTVIPSGTTLASPSSSDLKDLADAVTAAGVPAIFADSSQPDRLAEVMAAETGLRIEVIPLYSESLTAPGEAADTYLAMATANATSIANGLTQK